jgi:hypothetical protein
VSDVSLDNDVVGILAGREVTRLTHFTPARNLIKILLSGQILSTNDLVASKLDHVTTDADRWDGHLEMVCCSIQFPNVFYFQKAKAKPNALNYHDWVVFFLEPRLAGRMGTLFSPENAAVGRGTNLRAGAEGLSRLFDSQVGRFERGANHALGSPTDVQAEVLIPGSIELDQVKGIYLPSLAHVGQERGRLEQLGGNPDVFEWYACEPLFAVSSVVNAIQQSATLRAQAWKDNETNGDYIDC